MNKSDFDDLSDQSLSEATFEKNFEGIFEFDWKNKWLKG